MLMALIHRSIIVIAAMALVGCATADRLSKVGRAPSMSPIESGAAMTGIQSGEGLGRIQTERVRQARAAALADARRRSTNPNSLWVASNASNFFGDPRASQVGDILTININIADSASLSNATDRSRTNANDSDLTNLLGGEAALGQVFNDAINAGSIASFGSATSTSGAGSISRSETITLTAAAIVTEILWNNNLVVHGRQEVRINNEVRELLISGIVRPEDIAADNTIDHQKIAEARISYGGRGHISEMQRPPVGQELYDLLWPF